jgi:hypothetical protein
MMKSKFVCPHCQGVLNPNLKILLVATYKRRRGMLLMSPQPGNYKVLCDDSLQDVLEVGKPVAFSCPLCAEDLAATGNPKFVRLEKHTPGQSVRRVEFSRIYGTHATFIIDETEVTAYGEDAEDLGGKNFFGA